MKKKTPEDWMSDISNALHFRETFGRESHWADLEDSYMNDPNGDTAIGPNLVYSYGDSLMSMLSVPDPEFLVAPETRDGVKTAPIVERLAAQLTRKTRMKKAVDSGLLNAYLYGRLILKVGYDSLYGFDPYYDIGSREQPMGMTLTQFDKKGKRLEFGPQKPGWPWVRPVMPHDFVVPWGTVDIESAPWCAFRFIREVSAMKSDPKYKNTTRLQADMNMEEFMNSYKTVGAKRMKYESARTHDYNNKKALFKEFWEIRDASSHRIMVVTDDYDKFLRDDFDAIQMACGQLPVVTGTFVQHPRSFWTSPLAYYLGQIQHTQFDISLQAEKQRRLSVLKFLVRKGVLTEEARTRLLSGDVGACEEAELGTSTSINEVFGTVPTGNPINFQLHSDTNRADARDMIGFSRNQVGEYDSSSRRTAREATFVNQGSERRSGKRMQMISDVYRDTLRLENKLVFKFWTTPRDVMVENGWASVTGRQLASDYAYDLTLSSKRNVSKAQRKVEAFQVFMQMAQFPGANLPMLYQYLMDAANDPAFEQLLPSPGSNQGGRSPSGGMPTIPGSA